jgi:P22 tail accessory factor
MVDLSEDRIEQLETLVTSLRHDVRGIVTPVALAAHHLHKRSDSVSQHSAAMIDKMIDRLVLRLNSTYELVPRSRDSVRHVLAAHDRPNGADDAIHAKAVASVSA